MFAPQSCERLRMSMPRPRRKAAVIHAVGEVNLGNVARLRELLGQRLRTALRLVVLD